MYDSQGQRPTMSEPVELKFRIDAFTPETIPMATLAAFLRDLAMILGEQHSVHFDRLEPGSTTAVARIENEALPSVIKRTQSVRMNEGPADAMRAKRNVEKRLVEHNANGAELLDHEGARILHFRGRGTAQEIYGPVRQQGELIGGVVMIGGINDPVPVHLLDGERVHVCEAKLDVAKRLRPLLFETPIRASGYGVYYRNNQGEWERSLFRIADFERLDPASFTSVIEQMRHVKAEWLELPDPLSTIRDE
jgi:hypothetical protein